ncbi:zonula occludens toxin [Acidovorax sp. CF316]|uniref:zonular occludens toxin domain-containing protein n=1 Tax=Acidovorax sp. CF316 TaxID=1144317 RepID=UPI00026BD756|nr:zonular occludens toxin domain-containing protein [Acidovorax sp. CF316]EJE52902.1 zonula occludens toxin [Acidovorax sp. CF316]
MINGLEGIPGSGKSYEAVVYHVLDALKKGRKVITNLPLQVAMFAAIDPAYAELVEVLVKPRPIIGVWNAAAVDDKGNGQAYKLFEDGRKEQPGEGVSVFGHVWDYLSDWKHPETGQGPLFVIDECHVPIPQQGTDKQVVEWFKLHRHFNADVLLMTQSFRDMNQPIARLIGFLTKVRKADVFGRKDAYIRKVHAGYRGAVISTEERPYKPQFFGLYKSHTQGNSVGESSASDVAPFIVKFRRFTWAWWGLTAIAAAWYLWPADKAKKTPAPAVAQASAAARAPAAPAGPANAASHATAPAPAKTASEPDPNATPEPFAGKTLHLTGRITMRGVDVYTFAVSNAAQRVSTMDSRDLVQMGYQWQPLTDCAGVLRWEGKPKAITCDAPAMAQWSADKPIVVQSGKDRPGQPGTHAASPAQTVPMPEFQRPQDGQITQADLTAALRVKNPAFAGGRGNLQ